MGFSHRDIRPAMDVYTLDNVYLGSVFDVIPGPPSRAEEIVFEEARQTSEVNGEMLGPMPTQSIGNPGPQTQSAAKLYATEPTSGQSLGQGAIKVGKWWGLVNRRTIPLEAIQTVSLERVILKHRKEDLHQAQS
jgi:hypothetical protein